VIDLPKNMTVRRLENKTSEHPFSGQKCDRSEISIFFVEIIVIPLVDSELAIILFCLITPFYPMSVVSRL
jgi:hypothetical protein